MSDTFGKVVSIWIGCVCLFLIPIVLAGSAFANAEQLYILTETSYFVDSVRNTGILTKAMAEEFEEKLSKLSGIYEAELEHASMTYAKPNKEYVIQKDCYYTKQIKEELEKTKNYRFSQGDFFKVCIREKKSGIGKVLQNLLLGTEWLENGLVAYYGGMIRFEVE